MIYIFTFRTMIYDYLDREKLQSIVMQAMIDSDISRTMLLINGRTLAFIEMQNLSDDELMEKMQNILNVSKIDYDIEKENVPEGNENDLYRYSKETLDDMFANDREEQIARDEWARGQ